MKNNFEAKHIKKAVEVLAKHLRAVEVHSDLNQDYKKGILKEPSVWKKVSTFFKS